MDAALAESLLPWFVLRSVPGVGNLLCKRLVDRFGTAEAVLAAPPEALATVDGLPERVARTIPDHGPSDAVRRELDRLVASPYQVLTLADPAYPPALREIPDPPPFLYVHGQLNPSDRAVALVGSRHPSPYGLRTARSLAAALSRHDVTVVSGMARGIDTAAHQGTLDAGGRTVAVLGSGLDKPYPPESRPLLDRIAASGAVVSEFALQAGPEAHHFPIRNRVISGLSLGTVVVEAAVRSGALITARLAAEQGREVFAVPGPIHSGRSAGAHRLLKDGARLVEGVDDILEELSAHLEATSSNPKRSVEPVSPPPDLDPDAARLFLALGEDPVHIDELVRALSLDPARLMGLLLELELRGLVAQLPGKRFLRAGSAA
ncbi:MAG: DNA-processing protein DprA [Desulfococcaceae bacterium]